MTAPVKEHVQQGEAIVFLDTLFWYFGMRFLYDRIEYSKQLAPSNRSVCPTVYPSTRIFDLHCQVSLE